MDGKFLIQDLAEQLAAAEGLQKNEAQAFVRVFFETITKGLEEDKYVKVKGLGTFKLVEVDSRESVNVNTGERFMIDGHAKISFTPDNGLKELVNRPFADFETVVLSDEITEDALDEVDRKFEEELPADEEQAEVADIPVEVPQVEIALPEEKPAEETVSPTEAEEGPEVSPLESPEPTDETILENPKEPVVIEQAPVETKDSEEQKAEFEKKEEPAIVPILNIPEENIAEEEIPQLHTAPSGPMMVKLVEPVNVNVSAQPAEQQQKEEEPEPRSNHFRNIWIVLCIVALLLGYMLGYFNVFSPKGGYRPEVFHDTVYVKRIVHDTVTVEKVVPNEMIKEEPKEEAKPTAPVAQAKPAAEVPSNIPQLKGGAFLIIGTKSTYTLRGGETIRIIAERYYGSREMAPYIALYNNISDPNMVAAGTVLKIPELKRKGK